MNKLHKNVAASLLTLVTGGAWAQDSTQRGEKASEKPAEKPAWRLKGDFKGHPVTPAPEGEAEGKKESPKSQPAKPVEKPLVIDNALIQRGTPKSTGKPAAKLPAFPVHDTVAAPPAIVAIPPVDLNGNGEVYWHAKAMQLRDRLVQAQQTLEAAQLEEKREENDFYAWD